MKLKQLKFLVVWLAMLSSTTCFAWDFVLEPFNKSSDIYKPVPVNDSNLTLMGFMQGISLPAGGSALFRILVPPGISIASISAQMVSNNEYAMVGAFKSDPITVSPEVLQAIPYLINQILYKGVPLTEPTYIYFVLYYKPFTNSTLYIPEFAVNMAVQDKNLYMAWLNGNGEVCLPATIDADLNLHIPSLTYNEVHLSADLHFAPAANKLLFEVIKYNVVSSSCFSASLSPEFKLHIPAVLYNNNKLWADLQLYSPNNNGKFIFELTNYGSIP